VLLSFVLKVSYCVCVNSIAIKEVPTTPQTFLSFAMFSGIKSVGFASVTWLNTLPLVGVIT
jgi:hypothetical protein